MRKFEWSGEKAKTNLAKHGVSFELASRIWDDQSHLVIPDEVYDGEERWLAIGTVGLITILVAVYADRDTGYEEVIRIISARKATASERRKYEKQTS